MGELASSWLHPLRSWSLRETRGGSVRRPVDGLCWSFTSDLARLMLICSTDKDRLSRNEPVQSEYLTLAILWRLPTIRQERAWNPRWRCRRMNEKQRIATRRYGADQARLERKSAETKARWDDPEERSKLRQGSGTPIVATGLQRPCERDGLILQAARR